jgi:hypothetical protein
MVAPNRKGRHPERKRKKKREREREKEGKSGEMECLDCVTARKEGE